MLLFAFSVLRGGDMRALIVEDDPVSAKLIDAALKSEGIIGEATETGEDAIDLAKHYDYDIILLDIRLPDMEWVEVIRRLRSAGVRTPALVLSGINETDDKVRLLATAAEDYLTMPFHASELIARIHAVVRRSKGHSDSVIKTGKLVVNLNTRSVEVDGRRLHVTSKEYSILELLSLRKGVTLTKEMILDHLYGGIDEPELKIIDIFITKLRKKIAVATGGEWYIETVWGRGYVLKDPRKAKALRVAKIIPIFPRLDREFQKGVLEALDTLNEAPLPTVPKPAALQPRQRRIFLAHAREDKERVRQLYATLKASGFDPWLDEVDLLPGQNWKAEIERAIRDAGVFLACLSCISVAKEGYVQTEFRTALSVYSERPPGSIYLIPLKLDECEVPDMQIPQRGITMRDIHYVELWEESGTERLTEAIKHGLATSSSS
jgi:two-component system cell cycle response regulator CtrA